MADAGIFIAWGKPVPGREVLAAEVFERAVDMWTRLEQAGKIEGFEIVSLEPHGDINDYFLLRGDRDQIAQLRVSDEFLELSERASMLLWGYRVIGARVGDAAWGKIKRFAQAAQRFQPAPGSLEGMAWIPVMRG